MVTFTLNCKVKDGNPQTQLIPEEATLLCKSSSDAESWAHSNAARRHLPAAPSDLPKSGGPPLWHMPVGKWSK